MKTFKEFKEEILKRAKEADACKPEYGRAYKSETFDELMLVIKDNFSFAVDKKVIDPELIEDYKEEFMTSDIYCNQYTEKGYLLVSDFTMENINGNVVVNVRDNATIQNVWDNATIQNVWGNATIQNVWGNATIQNVRGNATIQDVRDNATIQDVWDNATIQNVRDNATIQNVWGNATIQDVRDNATIQDVWGNATIQDVRDNATIQNVRGNATIQDVRDNATIQDVRDNAYISSYYVIECKLHDNAILRIRKDNIIQYVSNDIKMEKQV